MNPEDEEFLARLLETFREEAQDHMKAIISGVITLEKNPASSQYSIIEPTFRATHSLKGAARAVDFREIEILCQNLESVFVSVRDKKITLMPDDFDLIHKVIAALEGQLRGDKKIKTGPLIIDLKNLSSGIGKTLEIEGNSLLSCGETITEGQIEDNRDLKDEDSSGHIEKINTATSATVRISEERIRSLYDATDDLLSIKLASATHLKDTRNISGLLQRWRWNLVNIEREIDSIRKNNPDNNAADGLKKLLDKSKETLGICETSLYSLIRSLDQEQHEMNSVINGLVDSIREIVLVPVSSLTEGFPRIIRDLAREKKKEIDLIINGSDIEIDRRILDTIKDPIIHILRNAVDHGIESPDIRINQGKARKGIIKIDISHAKAHRVAIRISDDGRGLDLNAIAAAAVNGGVIPDNDIVSMNPDEIINLIFRSGLSTSETISTVSGRGLGLAIVWEKVNQIGGIINVENNPLKGLTFTLVLPINLATYQGIHIFTDRNQYFFPLQKIERVFFPDNENMSTIEGRTVYSYGDEMIPVGHLGQILGIPETSSDKNQKKVMVIFMHKGKRTGVMVDKIAGSQEIVVRDLGPQIRSVRFISGVTILDNNIVVPVLNLEDIAETLYGQEQSVSLSIETAQRISEKRKILVAEDSITSRMLLKNILEGAGYEIITAVDGLDALTKLKVDPVDLVVSDIDMPRMNGFVLTEKIRSEKNLSEIPVVLVTSLDSREDREHGIAIGASAYIIKSSFDQANLLDVIKKLII